MTNFILVYNNKEIKNNIYKTKKKLNETDLEVIEKKKNRDAMMNRLLELF